MDQRRLAPLTLCPVLGLLKASMITSEVWSAARPKAGRPAWGRRKEQKKASVGVEGPPKTALFWR